jgi:hypothetical protein
MSAHVERSPGAVIRCAVAALFAAVGFAYLLGALGPTIAGG